MDSRIRLLELRRPVRMIPLESENEEGELAETLEVSKHLLAEFQAKLTEDHWGLTLEKLFTLHINNDPNGGEDSIESVVMYDGHDFTYGEIARYWNQAGRSRTWTDVRTLVNRDKRKLFPEFEELGIQSSKEL